VRNQVSAIRKALRMLARWQGSHVPLKIQAVEEVAAEQVRSTSVLSLESGLLALSYGV